MQQSKHLQQLPYIPATNRLATSIHGEMPMKYIKQPPICGKFATRSTSFVLCERSDHLKQSAYFAPARYTEYMKYSTKLQTS